jgi:CDP-4-dehydro-6-deoxyglucose reductase
MNPGGDITRFVGRSRQGVLSLNEARTGREGFVHYAVMAGLPELSAHQVDACGVPAMVDAAQRDFVNERGLPAAGLYANAVTPQAVRHGD